MKKYQVRNGRELAEKEYKIYLEGMAEGVCKTIEEFTNNDLALKWSDPLYVGNDLSNVYSYAFDFHDGGRHHYFRSLEDIYAGLLKEIEKCKKDQ